MKLNAISFKDDDGYAAPETITVTMTVEEALWIARVAEKQRGGSPHRTLYDCLVCDLFNRFWEDGVNDAAKQYPFEIPPIVYTN
jgi:hypothetical protein